MRERARTATGSAKEELDELSKGWDDAMTDLRTSTQAAKEKFEGD